jgi:hypothetical protein
MIRMATAPKSVPDWHELFLRMLPAIRQHARIAFRRYNPDAREEAIQSAVCNARAAMARLAELGKLDLAYASVLARYGVAQVRDGRMTGGHLNCKDAMSPYCQRLKDVIVERLDRYDSATGEWEEIIIEDRHASPADVVRFRLDFAAWLRTLPGRNRRIAVTLALGHRTSDVAKRFRVCQGRVSQLRRELHTAWQRFHGEPEPPQVTAALV